MKMKIVRFCEECNKYRDFKTFWFEKSALFECTICGEYHKEGER